MNNSFSTADRPETPKEKATSLFLVHHRFVEMLAFKAAPIGNIQQDIVHDCFIAFVEKADQWNLDADVRPVLLRITRNIAVNYWKKYLRTLPEQLRETYEYAYATRMESTEFSLCDKLATEEEVSVLRLCIQKLTPECRTILEQ
ncbi:MAG: hypothetical protein PHQ75_13095, partial [Thermoguttaceae bacterium]|nr:hypothetical protein [Thermoguttaceae bacterium]